MVNNIIDKYMENSKNKAVLCMILGIMEFMNAPLKTLYLLIPIVAYILALFNRDQFMLPLIPAAIQPKYEICINILLVAVFVLLEKAVIVTVGRRVYNKETALFVECFQNQQVYQHESNVKIHLIYKRKRNGITIRKIYSHIDVGEWNKQSVKILHLFNAHFVDSCRFQSDNRNSLIIIMRTAEGLKRPLKTELHDSTLDKDMNDVTTWL